MSRTIRAAIGLLLLALPLATLVNLVSLERSGRVAFLREPPLDGATFQSPYTWKFPVAFFDGRMQKGLAWHIREGIPKYATLVRFNNEILFRFFAKPTAPHIVIGGDRVLIEEDYLKEYCARTPGLGAASAAQAIPRLLAIQNYYRSRGKSFLYLVTPSKAASLPQSFLESWGCTNDPAARAAFVPEFVAALKAAGVETVDAATPLRDFAGRRGIDVFPAGGAHWNDLAGAEITRDIIDVLNRQAGRTVAPGYTYSYEMIPAKQADVERDLAKLLNVMRPPIAYTVPKVSFKGAMPCAEAPGRKLDVAMVGGSFSHVPATILIDQSCFTQLHVYFYLRAMRLGGSPYVVQSGRVDDAELQRLRDVDIMILEGNESSRGGSFYIAALQGILGAH